jgi:catechol 2,3-dioxygenase-like lactoylglutathione lyase family enzyme
MQFQSLHPIGDTDPMNLPVADLEQATLFYTQQMGFELRRTVAEPASVILGRDAVEIGLAVNGLDPEQASCYIAVADVDQVFEEYRSKGLQVSAEVGPTEHGGRQYRVFFVRDPDGICYCIGTASSD